MTDSPRENGRYRIGGAHSITIGLNTATQVVGLVVILSTAVWAVANISGGVDLLNERIRALTVAIERMENTIQDQDDRIRGIEFQVRENTIRLNNNEMHTLPPANPNKE